MTHIHPKQMLLIGFFMVLVGFILPLLMVIRVVEPTYFLSFISWGASTGGLFLGLIGAAWYVRSKNKE